MERKGFGRTCLGARLTSISLRGFGGLANVMGFHCRRRRLLGGRPNRRFGFGRRRHVFDLAVSSRSRML